MRGRFTLDEVTDLDKASRFDPVRPCDIKGILHSHSRYTDGTHTLGSMVDTARHIGLEYLGVSDHFRSAEHAEGLDVHSAQVQRQEVNILQSKYDDFDILHGVEVDIDPEGTLPVDDEILMFFDYVIASFPTEQNDCLGDLVDRVVKVAAHPLVKILGQPLGDCLLSCKSDPGALEQILLAAGENHTAVELNANPHSLELTWDCCRTAQDMGVFLVVSPNAHRAARLVDYRHGTELAGDAGLYRSGILNTLSVSEMRDFLRIPSQY